VKQELVQTLAAGTGAFVHGQTFSHTPVICAAGLATLRYLKRKGLVERCAKTGPYLMERLDGLRKFPFVGDIRGKGLMVGIEFVENRTSKQPFPRERHFAEKVVHAALRNGLVLWYNTGHVDGGDGDLIILGPPFTITREEIDELVDLLTATLRDVAEIC
jgi:adenosylmethionine-8-amino-7-oxononanoate aminotransferase